MKIVINVILDIFYNSCWWNRCLFCLFSLVLKKKDVTRVEFGTCTQTTFIKVKQINTKNRTYYFYNDQINLKDFDARLLKVDKKNYNKINIYYIGYVTVKKLLIATI